MFVCLYDSTVCGCVFLFENVHLLSVELSMNESIAVVYTLLSTHTAALRIVKVGEMLALLNVLHTLNKKNQILLINIF
jgi:hypothetical protein